MQYISRYHPYDWRLFGRNSPLLGMEEYYEPTKETIKEYKKIHQQLENGNMSLSDAHEQGYTIFKYDADDTLFDKFEYLGDMSSGELFKYYLDHELTYLKLKLDKDLLNIYNHEFDKVNEYYPNELWWFCDKEIYNRFLQHEEINIRAVKSRKDYMKVLNWVSVEDGVKYLHECCESYGEMQNILMQLDNREEILEQYILDIDDKQVIINMLNEMDFSLLLQNGCYAITIAARIIRFEDITLVKRLFNDRPFDFDTTDDEIFEAIAETNQTIIIWFYSWIKGVFGEISHISQEGFRMLIHAAISANKRENVLLLYGIYLDKFEIETLNNYVEYSINYYNGGADLETLKYLTTLIY